MESVRHLRRPVTALALLFILLVLLTTACGVVIHKPLNSDQRLTQSVAVSSTIPENEITLPIKQSNLEGGGGAFFGS